MRRVFFFLLLTSTAFGQLWSGVLASSRAVDWRKAGAGALPTLTQCGTVAPYGFNYRTNASGTASGTTWTDTTATFPTASTGTYIQLLPPYTGNAPTTLGTMTTSGSTGTVSGVTVSTAWVNGYIVIDGYFSAQITAVNVGAHTVTLSPTPPTFTSVPFYGAPVITTVTYASPTSLTLGAVAPFASTYTGPGFASPSTIQTAYNSCSAGTYLTLSAGTFYINGSITMQSGVFIEGVDAATTKLVSLSGGGSNGIPGGVFIFTNGDGGNYQGGPSNYGTWSTLSAGATSGTLTVTHGSAPVVGNSMVIYQQDPNPDTGTIWPCNAGTTQSGTSYPATWCSFENEPGNNGPSGYSMTQTVQVCSVSGTGPYTVGWTADSSYNYGTNTCPTQTGLYSPNWSGSLSPKAYWSTTTPINNAGVMNLTIDASLAVDSPASAGTLVGLMWAEGNFIIGNRLINALRPPYRNLIWLYQSAHNTIQSNYGYGSNGSDLSYGFESGYESDNNLEANNIFQHVSSPMMVNGGEGNVFIHNYSVDEFYTAQGTSPNFQQSDNYAGHQDGAAFGLFESNVGTKFVADVIHGTSWMNTCFRCRLSGMDGPYKVQSTMTNDQQAFGRYNHVVNSVLGTQGYHTQYMTNPLNSTDNTECALNSTQQSIFVMGFSAREGCYGGAVSGTVTLNDINTAAFAMQWGNYDVVTGGVRFCDVSASTGWVTYCNPSTATFSGSGVIANNVAVVNTTTQSFDVGQIINTTAPSGTNGAHFACAGGIVQAATGSSVTYTCATSTMTTTTLTTLTGGSLSVGTEVPTALPTYPAIHPTLGDTGRGQAVMPPSFYYSAPPSYWGTTQGTPPWPAIGGDVTGGNISGTAGHANQIPAQLVFNALPIDTNYATPLAVTSITISGTTATMSFSGTAPAAFVQYETLWLTGTNTALVNTPWQIATIGVGNTSPITFTVAVGTETPPVCAPCTGGTAYVGAVRLFSASNYVAMVPAPPNGLSGNAALEGGTEYADSYDYAAQLPINYANPHECDQTPAYTVLLGTSSNKGPNCHNGTPPACSATTYTNDLSGLQDALNNWRDNADNVGGVAHFADFAWLVQVPHGTFMHGATTGSKQALITLPGKLNGTAEPTQCLWVDSDTPLPNNQIACSHGIPGFGGVRNPGCNGSVAGSNDVASMWTISMDSAAGAGYEDIIGDYDTGNTYAPTAYANHIVVADAELTETAGHFQSGSSTTNPRPIRLDNMTDHLHLKKLYVHGWDPGDPGQPSGGCGATAVGTGWNFTGVVTTSSTGNTVTLVSGSGFGNTFQPGQGNFIITGGSNPGTYTIATHDPTVSNTVLTLTTNPGNNVGVTYSYFNPPTRFANGCGDDMQEAVTLNTSWSSLEWSYIEKVHWFGAESHGIGWGFSKGPLLVAHNFVEGGSITMFSGGNPVDTTGGPVYDGTVRGNYFGKNLDWRFISAGAGNSPAPPFGDGPFDGVASHADEAVPWAIKNSFELKLGLRVLIDGNVICCNWSDAQTGNVILFNARTCSGGSACGVFGPDGQPLTQITNVTWSNNIFANAPQGLEMATRSTTPGNGGGVSKPIEYVDIYNNLFVNIYDTAQWGNPGLTLYEYQQGTNQFVNCVMTRLNNKAKAVCPVINNTSSYVHTVLTGLSRTSNVVKAQWGSLRQDPQVGGTTTVFTQDWSASTTFPITKIRPTVNNTGGFIYQGTAGKTGATEPNWSTSCPASGNTCTDNTITWTNTGLTTQGVEGSYPIASVSQGSVTTICTTSNGPQPCVGKNGVADGTFGDTFYFSQVAANNAYCTNAATCTATGLVVNFPTLAYSILDITAGDGVQTTLCTDTSYNTPTNSSTYAVPPTIPNSLTVYFTNNGPNDSSGTATCQVSNGVGFAKNLTFSNNTIVSSGGPSITEENGTPAQIIGNHFRNNIFAETGTHTGITCIGQSGEGSNALQCWDQNTLQFSGNVMQGRSSSLWYGTSTGYPNNYPVNYFPTTASCSGTTATSSCIGFAGFLNGTTFPTTPCAKTGAPYNCPLMMLPWANNVTLNSFALDGSSSYLGAGISASAISTHITQTQYTCPATQYCGGGPPPD